MDHSLYKGRNVFFLVGEKKNLLNVAIKCLFSIWWAEKVHRKDKGFEMVSKILLNIIFQIALPQLTERKPHENALKNTEHSDHTSKV